MTQDELVANFRHLLDLAETNGRLPQAAYHVVLIPDAGEHVYLTFPDVAGAVAGIREHLGQDVKVRVFYGRACGITRPPARFLVTHEGRHPLFDTALEDDELDPSGSLLPLNPLIVPSPAVPASAVPQEQVDSDDDEEDNDDEEDDDE